MNSNGRRPSAMAFHHPKGLVPAYRQAEKFMGEGGRLATLPDIIAARLATKLQAVQWTQYFTTTTAEYVGLSAGGNPIAIVAHGIGPMATIEGMLAAYAYQYKDSQGNRRGGRISQSDFRKLENGGFGDVTVVDLAATWARREYHFSYHPITIEEIGAEPLWRARLGEKWEEYCKRHDAMADAWAEARDEDTYDRYCILGMAGAGNCSYSERLMFDHWMKRSPDMAVAHLISIGGLTKNAHQYWSSDYRLAENRVSISCEVDCHEWSNGVRLCAIRGGTPGDIHPGVGDMTELMAANVDRLMRPCDAQDREHGFFALMNFGEEMFTQRSKMGRSMDTFDPEFKVTKIEPIRGGPTIFRTTIHGFEGFFRYGTNEVERIAPVGANAYKLSGGMHLENNAEGTPAHHITLIEFYRVEIDATQRMPLEKDLYDDFDLLMELLGTNAR